MSTDHDRIAVVDFGGQYAHLIATKVRRAQVLAEIRQPEDATEAFAGYKGVILSGSPSLSAFGEDADWNKEILELDVPILGFCFGHQEIAKRYGGEVIHGGREWGHADLHIRREHPLFKGLDKVEQVWMSHFDSVVIDEFILSDNEFKLSIFFIVNVNHSFFHSDSVSCINRSMVDKPLFSMKYLAKFAPKKSYKIFEVHCINFQHEDKSWWGRK